MNFVTSKLLSAIMVGCLMTVLGYHSSLVAQTTSPQAGESEDEGSPWVSMSPTGARATFEMPERPRFVERKFPPIPDKPPVRVRLHLCTVHEGNTTYVFGYHDLHETPADATIVKNTLEGAVRGSVVNVFGQLVDAKTHGMKSNPVAIRYGEYPGREYVYRFAQNEKPYTVSSRVFLVGRRQYQLSYITADELYQKSLANKYFNSFRLIIPESDLPPRPKVSN